MKKIFSKTELIIMGAGAFISAFLGLRLATAYKLASSEGKGVINSVSGAFESVTQNFFNFSGFYLGAFKGAGIGVLVFLAAFLYFKFSAPRKYQEEPEEEYFEIQDEIDAQPEELSDWELKRLSYIKDLAITEFDDSKTSAIEEINKMVGIETIKDELNAIINYEKAQQARRAQGMEATAITHHMVFTGNAGTGKTTVARYLAQALKEVGVLSKGHLVEVDRANLIAEYVGQTAPKVREVVNVAMGGVLFIDEAYAVTQDDDIDYGKEAVATLLKIMEDRREDLVVIAAGYSNLMAEFIESNPGLKSRFNKFLHFPDYTPEELTQIFRYFCSRKGYTYDPDVEEKLLPYFEEKIENADETFANARFVRNLFERTLVNQVRRVSGIQVETGFEHSTIEPEDIQFEEDLDA